MNRPGCGRHFGHIEHTDGSRVPTGSAEALLDQALRRARQLKQEQPSASEWPSALGQIFDRCSRVCLSQSRQRGDRDIDRAGCFRDHPQRFGIESDVGEIELLISAATHPRRPRCSEGRSSQPRPSSAHCKESAVRSTAVRLQTGICLSEVSRLRYCL